MLDYLQFRLKYTWARTRARAVMLGQTIEDFFAYRKLGWKSTHYRDLLHEYFVDQVKNHGLVDFHVSNYVNVPLNTERTAKAVLETVTGQRSTVDLNDAVF